MVVSWTMKYMVIKILSVFCFLLNDLLTLFWAFTMSWANCSISGQCVGRGYQVGGGFVGCGYPVGGVGSWLLAVSSSPLSTVYLSPSWIE